jgi:predicted RNase H-like HicB family nuclease
VITLYIQAAMTHAVFEELDSGEHYAEIPECPGAWATGSTIEECRQELQEVLEDWLLLKVHDHDPLPVIDGIDLNLKAA